MNIQFIAEIGNNHHGNIALAERMVEAALNAGADFVKFQIYDIERFVASGNPYFAELAHESLSFEEFAHLKSFIEAKGGRFLATPFDLGSLEFLDRLGCDTIKIASGDIDNFDLIGRAAELGKKLIVSVGGAELAEIDATVEFMRAKGAEFTLLHCVLAYPASFAELNLRFIRTLAERYGVPVGYSDHSLGVEAPLGAIALGATTIEKHFTTDQCLPGGDNEMSILPDDFTRLCREGRNIFSALGLADRVPSETEQRIRVLVRRTYHATRDIVAGTILSGSDFELLRPAKSGIGLSAAQRDLLIGRELRSDLHKGEAISKDAIIPIR